MGHAGASAFSLFPVSAERGRASEGCASFRWQQRTARASSTRRAATTAHISAVLALKSLRCACHGRWHRQH